MIKGHTKVHIVPVAFEIDRAIKPVRENGADKVYILTGAQEGEGPRSSLYAQEVKRALEKEAEVEIVNYGFYDYANIFSRLVGIGRKEQGNDVLINLSSGGHIVSIAGTLAASMFGWTPYYVEPKVYNIDRGKPEGMTSGVKRVFEIRTYPIEKPEDELVECLKLVEGVQTQKSLMQKLEKKGLLRDEKPGDMLSKRAQMEFRRRFLEPLLEKGWLVKDGRGKRSRLEISEAGKEIVKIFE